jgi:hypothetical protein
LLGNTTSGTADVAGFTIGGLTNKTTPTGADILLIQDQAASGALKYSTLTQAITAVTSGVSSIGGVTGAVTLGTGLAMSGQALQVNGNNAFGAPAFRVHLAANQSVTANTTTKINFDTVVIDTASGWSAANHNYVVPVAGTYLIGVGMAATGTFVAGTTVVEVFLSKNGIFGGAGTGFLDCVTQATGTTGATAPGNSTIIALAVNDTIEADCSIGGTSPNVQGVAAPNIRTYLWGYRIGP